MLRNLRNNLTFYQWDVNQRLICSDTPDGIEVHFIVNNSCLVMLTYLENKMCYVDVPNNVFQSSGSVEVYLYLTEGTEGHSEQRSVLKILPRTKPEDYVYEETPVISYRLLAEQMEHSIHEGKDEILAAIDQAVFDKQLLTSILAGTCEYLTGDAITAVADYIFYNNLTLRSVDLPNCIHIGNQAFSGCENLESLKLPMLFLTDSQAFSDCSSLVTVDLPNLTAAGEHTFSGCRKLVSAYLPALTTIPVSMFNRCESLKELFHTDIQSIGSYAFYNCTSLEEVCFPNISEIQMRTFYSCSALHSADIPKVESIAEYGFGGCSGLETIHVPMLKIVGNYAFTNCESLSHIDMENITEVNSNAFLNCTALTEVGFRKMETLSYYAFQGCTALKKVFLPLSVQRILASGYRNSPFYNCTNPALRIFCEAESQPAGWGQYWNYVDSSVTIPVTWGATYQDYLAYEN